MTQNDVKLAISITNEYIIGWQSKQKWTARLRALGVMPVMQQNCVLGLYAVPNGDGYAAFAKWCKKSHDTLIAFGQIPCMWGVEDLHIVASASSKHFSPFFVATKEE